MTIAPQGETIAVRNPYTGQVDFQIRAPSATQLQSLAAALRAAQPSWAARSLAERTAILQRWRAELERHSSDIVGALTIDTGRRLLAAGELQAVRGMIERWSALAPTLAQANEGRSTVHPNLTYRSQFVPYPLIGVISPWNFPLTLALIDAIPALFAGCAVLIKPSEITPRFVEPLRATVAKVPELDAVLQLWPGGAATGEQLVGLVDAVCFTGSVPTGRKVAENAARHFIPAFLELGGKDPLIVTASADLERASDIVLRASCLATGQACQSIERVYVPREQHDAFVERLVAKARRVDINWPDPRRGIIGPFIFARQADIVAAQLADAVRKGARILTGGQIEDHGGKWLRPTVLVGVDHTMTVMTEETFGPVMPVMPYDDIEQAIALANDGIYGLSAAVVAGSLAEAETIALRLDAGGVSLNDGALTAIMHEAEKHSFKLSGMGGSRMGPAGYLRFFRKKALIRQTGVPMSIEMTAESNYHD
ncbi:MAG: aldehyde dehydrogenase family protein [Steroidobacteraceae bacterium]|nr:aldehyde dehydrogenase family protein [Steroidobacteraceae bacterium]MDW8259800.1 aldehyde dehydrogenase family protein [Gammaproteobacteria bacterium]